MRHWQPLTALALGVVLVGVGLYIVLSPDDPERVVKTSWGAKPPSGPVRFCTGSDVSKSQRRTQRDYANRFAPGSRLLFSRAAFSADSQHDLYLNRVRQNRDDCDVIALDVIYMKEFSDGGLLYDMTPYFDHHDRRADFDGRILKTAEHDGGLWGVPSQFDVGTLYYRDDRVSRPDSWQDVYRQARPRRPGDMPGLRIQVGPYEGLTVAFLELVHAAGAAPIVSEDGTTAQLNQDEVAEALKFLQDAVRDRVIPRKDQPDTSNLAMYELGRASFLRGWPFIQARLRADADTGDNPPARHARSAAAANTRIAPLPPWRPNGESVGVIGGHHLVIPRSAPNPSGALRLIDYLTSDEQVRKGVEEDSQYPVLRSMADEPGLGNRDLIDAVKATRLVARPSLVRYADVSEIISCRVRGIMLGSGNVRDGLEEMNSEVQRVLDGGASTLKGSACPTPPS